ncbi:transmembrane protease serine 9-like [Uloborus diversus]|uniref:transmembrane protease serine 9-like n=1 Tax=Uloborus diversus TaxID=327109 RepID=UPI002409B864|nr:transmembrane protease serine 9-like [Uloborus diversus]
MDSLNRKHPLDYQECGVAEVSADLRIIGGRRAAKDSWPWQVVILNRFREPFCGGVLLSPQWALTAAHCVRRRLWIRAGEHDLSEQEGTEQEQKVVHSFVHPGYDSSTVEFDLALLRLRSPLTIDRHVRPACLPEDGDELPPYARATILGWGKRRNEASFGTDTLHQAEVPVIPLDECRLSYDDLFISENMICAGFDVGRVDSCAGDSGGPLLHKRDDGAWTIYGVTSFGDGCGQEGKFGVYTSVAKCIEWIRHIMQIQLL